MVVVAVVVVAVEVIIVTVVILVIVTVVVVVAAVVIFKIKYMQYMISCNNDVLFKPTMRATCQT